MDPLMLVVVLEVVSYRGGFFCGGLGMDQSFPLKAEGSHSVL
jgi:hypothetical protein